MVIAPEGMAWIEGYNRWTGYWDTLDSAVEEMDQTRVHYPVDDDDIGGVKVVCCAGR